MTQARAFGAFTGRGYGPFAGKAAPSAHDVETLTQPRAFGAMSGRRYGSFTGKAASSSGRPVGLLTQGQAFGAFAGRRYGAFDGREETPQPPSSGSAHRIRGKRPRKRIYLPEIDEKQIEETALVEPQQLKQPIGASGRPIERRLREERMLFLVTRLKR